MNTRVIRHDGDVVIDVQHLDPQALQVFGRIGAMSRQFVSVQDPELWRQVANDEFLGQIKEGAAALSLMGRRPCVRLTPSQAQYALGAACLLTLHLHGQPDAYRRDLLAALQVLAEACPCEIEVTSVPDPARMKSTNRWPGGCLAIYRKIREECIRGKKPTVSLGDAVRLLLGVPSARSKRLDPLIRALWVVSAGYRDSITRVLKGLT